MPTEVNSAVQSKATSRGASPMVKRQNFDIAKFTQKPAVVKPNVQMPRNPSGVLSPGAKGPPQQIKITYEKLKTPGQSVPTSFIKNSTTTLSSKNGTPAKIPKLKQTPNTRGYFSESMPLTKTLKGSKSSMLPNPKASEILPQAKAMRVHIELDSQ